MPTSVVIRVPVELEYEIREKIRKYRNEKVRGKNSKLKNTTSAA